MLISLIPTFFGVALILIHVLTREEKKEKHDEVEGMDNAK